MRFSTAANGDGRISGIPVIFGRPLCCILSLLLPATRSFAQDPPLYQFTPHVFDLVPNLLEDVPAFVKGASVTDHWQTYLGILSLSGGLIYYDQKLLDGSQKFAKNIHLIHSDANDNRSRRIATTRVAGINADLRVPSDLNSCFYFIGDGLTSLSIIGGLAVVGATSADNRALNTASQLMESMVLTGMFVITGKYLFGRESPSQESTPGGAWHPAPGVRNYLAKVSKHDAFPSGHIATATSTLMILHYNYPEKAWLMPAGYGALGLLMFAMLNNSVHWAGDYPLGIGIGYLAAATVFELRKPSQNAATGGRASAGSSFQLLPFANTQGVGVMVDIKT